MSGLAVVLCVKSNGTSSFVFDAADRLLASGSGVGVVYDSWGRTTTLPAGLTSTPVAGDVSSTYYVNDLVRSLTQGGGTRTWVLDPANRLASMSTTGLGSTGLVNHYSDVGYGNLPDHFERNLRAHPLVLGDLNAYLLVLRLNGRNRPCQTK